MTKSTFTPFRCSRVSGAVMQHTVRNVILNGMSMHWGNAAPTNVHILKYMKTHDDALSCVMV